MTQITIIGCGLIGGAFACLAKEQGVRIHGIDSNIDSLKKGQPLFDSTATTINEKDIDSSEYIFVATPISTIPKTIASLNQITNKTHTIIEFSSIKSILNCPDVLQSPHTIVSAHPMGGSDQQGIEYASAELLRNRPMIVFDDHPVVDFFKALSFKIIYCPNIETHDKWMAQVSHAPYVVSTLLPLALSSQPDDLLNQLRNVIAGGFTDTTRVSNSPIEWGVDVCLQNKTELLPMIDTIEQCLHQLKSAILNNNTQALTQLLNHAKQTRSRLIDAKK